MKAIHRILAILSCLVLSVVIINKTKVAVTVPAKEFKVACLAIVDEQAGIAFDEKLHEFYHIAHTAQERKGNDTVYYRCYFRFPPSDIACVPPEDPGSKDCACYVKSDGDRCYFPSNKYSSLIKLLNKPNVDRSAFHGPVVKKWQEVRDILLGTSEQ